MKERQCTSSAQITSSIFLNKFRCRGAVVALDDRSAVIDYIKLLGRHDCVCDRTRREHLLIKMRKLLYTKGLICFCETAIGILLLIDPVGFTSWIIRIGGAILLFAGIGFLIGYFKTEPEEAQREQGLVKALCALVVAVFCIFKAQWFIDTFPLITVLYGILILFSGVIKIQWAVDSVRLGRSRWYYSVISAVASVIFGVLTIVNPFATRQVLWTFVAVSLIVSAALDLTVIVVAGMTAREIKKSLVEKSPSGETPKTETDATSTESP